MLLCTILLIAQAMLAAAVFDKFSYFCAGSFFVLNAWAVHYQMHWLWQVLTLLLGVLFQLSIYAIDIWEEVANPFKGLTVVSAIVAIVFLAFCFVFLYQLNVERVHIQKFWRLNSIYLVLVLVLVFISCIRAAVSITDYFAPKNMSKVILKITKIYSKKIPRAGTTNYLEVSVDGIDRKFVTTSVAYSVLQFKKDISVNLYKAFSGALYVNNDFLRDQRGPWRLRVLGNILFLVLLIAAGYGLVYYLAVNTQ